MTFKIFAYDEGTEDVELTGLDLNELKAQFEKQGRKLTIYEDSKAKISAVELNNVSIRFDWDGNIHSAYSSRLSGGMEPRLTFTSDKGSVKWPCFKASLDHVLGTPIEVKESTGKVSGI